MTHPAFPDALASDVQGAIRALVDRENVTVKRALSVIERAASEIEANLTLLVQHEAPRQAKVEKQRAERERAEHVERERQAKAKAERVAARLARRAPKGKK